MREMQKPTGNESSGTKPRTAHMPEPAGGDFNDFLKPKHLGKSGKGTAKIIGVRDAPPNSFSDVIVETHMGKSTFDWGMRFSNGNYRRLFERFGPNPKKWKGTVKVGVKEHMGTKYVAIID